jgi:hypothetical protein
MKLQGSKPRSSGSAGPTGSETTTPTASKAEQAVAAARQPSKGIFATTNSLLNQLGTNLGNEVADHYKSAKKASQDDSAEKPSSCRIG